MNIKSVIFYEIMNNNGVAVINSRLKNYKILERKLLRKKIKIIKFGSRDVYFDNLINNSLFIYNKNYQIKDLNLNNIQKENLECAIACALAMNISIKKIIKSLYNLKSAPGRFDVINYTKKNSKIIIDYAHTPEAFQCLLKTYTNENLKPSIVFGCGGDRDKDKRKKMALIASKYAKKVYITDDNPRNENPKSIREILKKNCNIGIEISNRRKAIHVAISQIGNNDILIIAGKGHEKFQIIKNKKIKFDDYKIAKSFIKK